MLEVKLNNDPDYQALNQSQKVLLDQAILKLISLRFINIRVQTALDVYDSMPRNNGADLVVGPGAPGYPLNLSVGGKRLTNVNGSMSTKTLLEYLASEMEGNPGAYHGINAA